MREALLDGRAVFDPERAERLIDRSLAASSLDALAQGGLIHPAEVEAGAVVQHDLHGLDVMHGGAGILGLHAPAIVGEHAAEAAVGVGGGFRTPGEPKRLCRMHQIVTDHTRLHAGTPVGCVDLENSGLVLRKIDDHGSVYGLSRQRRSSAA